MRPIIASSASKHVQYYPRKYFPYIRRSVTFLPPPSLPLSLFATDKEKKKKGKRAPRCSNLRQIFEAISRSCNTKFGQRSPDNPFTLIGRTQRRCLNFTSSSTTRSVRLLAPEFPVTRNFREDPPQRTARMWRSLCKRNSFRCMNAAAAFASTIERQVPPLPECKLQSELSAPLFRDAPPLRYTGLLQVSRKLGQAGLLPQRDRTVCGKYPQIVSNRYREMRFPHFFLACYYIGKVSVHLCSSELRSLKALDKNTETARSIKSSYKNTLVIF